MKNSIYILLFSFFLLTLNSHAAIIRVNNAGIPADHTTFTAAHSAASTGDTIHLEPTGISYGNLSLSKPLIIIGNGYFLGQNQGLQYNIANSMVGNITVFAAASGSTLTGLTITGRISPWGSTVNNVTFLRCHLTGDLYTGGGTVSNSIVDNMLFDGCYIENSLTPINLIANVSNEVLFKNCYMEGGNLTLNANASGLFTNCIFNLTVGMAVSNYQFSNNILIQGDLTDQGGNNYNNNLCNLAQFPTGNGNQRLVDMNTVFVGYPSQGGFSDDSRWELAPASPGMGAGIGGDDCGIFGGAGPYKLSGIPPIPTIYDLVAPGSAGNTLQIIISTRVNN